MLTLTAQELSQLLKGVVEGDPTIKVQTLAKIEEAQKGQLSFIANPKYIPFAYSTNASILIVARDLVFDEPITSTLIRVQDPYQSFTFLLKKFSQQKVQQKQGIEQPVFIHETAQIGEGTYIGAFTYIGKAVKIGNNVKLFPQVHIGDYSTIADNTIIYAGAKIYDHTQVGTHCIIHAGAVIGSDGFGFAPQKDGSFQKIPQTGHVILEDEVEIGANTTIDRATMGSTIIRQGTKLDNLVQIAHNVTIGEHTVIAAQTGIAGSTQLGKQCMVGGQVGFVGHINIADQSKFGAQSGVAKTITQSGQAWMGSPAIAYRQHMRAQVALKQLPELQRKIRALEQQIQQMTDGEEL